MLLGLHYCITFLYCPNPASGLQYRNKRIVSRQLALWSTLKLVTIARHATQRNAQR